MKCWHSIEGGLFLPKGKKQDDVAVTKSGKERKYPSQCSTNEKGEEKQAEEKEEEEKNTKYVHNTKPSDSVQEVGPCSEQPIQTIRKKFNSPAEQNKARHTQRLISMMDKLTYSHLKKWNRRATNRHLNKNWICTTSRH